MTVRDFELALNDWIYVARERLHKDNVRYQVQEGLGSMTEAIDVQLWSAWKKEISFPVSFMDAVKVRFFPEWLLKVFPARVKRYSFAEVLPSLSKDKEVFQKQLDQKSIGEFESVSRKPTVSYEEFPPAWDR